MSMSLDYFLQFPWFDMYNWSIWYVSIRLHFDPLPSVLLKLLHYAVIQTQHTQLTTSMRVDYMPEPRTHTHTYTPSMLQMNE